MRCDLENNLLQAVRRGLVEGLELHGKAATRHGQVLHARGHGFRQRASGGLALVRQPPGQRHVGLVRSRHLLLQRLRIGGQFEFTKPEFQRRRKLRQFGGLYPELAAGRVQGFRARFDRAQGLGVELDPGSVVAQLAGRFADLRLGRIEHLDDGPQYRIVFGQLAQLRRDRRQPAKHGPFGLGQCLDRGLRPGEQAGAVRKARVLRRQGVPFALARRQALQFRHLVLQVGALRLALRILLGSLNSQRLEPLPGAPGRTGFAPQPLDACMPVEQRALRGRPHERLVRVLAMDVDEELAHLAQLRKRRPAAVHEGPRAPGPVDHAAHEEHAGVAGEFVFFEIARQFAAGDDVELGGQFRPLGRLPHHPGVGPPAHQQFEGVDEDGLAGAGLAGQYREAPVKFKLDRVDDDEIPDCEPVQHQRTGGALSSDSLQRSFSRSITK